MYYKQFYYQYLKNTAYIMYEVIYSSRTSYVSNNYFYCHIGPEGLSYIMYDEINFIICCWARPVSHS